MRPKRTSLVIAAVVAATLAPAGNAGALATGPGPRGVNDCRIAINGPYQTASCDYVGAGLFTVIDFSQTSGDIDATVSCGSFYRYYDYPTHDEVLTGPTYCHVEIFEYIAGSGGAGSLHVSNKYQ